MEAVEIQARAKINLSLDVIGRRPDGYHDVRMLMQTVGLHDDVRLDKHPEGIRLGIDVRSIPGGRGNTAWRAAAIFLERTGIKSGVCIKIKKRIPAAAGLAGGSADAAAVLRGMDALFGTHLPENALLDMGREIGADVPFCIKGGTMLAEGTGEVLTPVGPMPATDILLVKPRISVSTAWAYSILKPDEAAPHLHPDTNALIDAINRGRTDLLAQGMKNVLETVTMAKHPVIGRIKRELASMGALGAMMSGSGPTVFGIFNGQEAAQEACGALAGSGWTVIRTVAAAAGDPAAAAICI